MALLLFLICLTASSIGAIIGAGGGVIIKPVMDAVGFLPVSTVSFLSGCTVLAMSCSSLIRTRNNGVELKMRTTVPLALGAAIGGVCGKLLFELLRNSFESEQVLGTVQAACLAFFTLAILIYVIFKEKLPRKNVDSLAAAMLIGLLLGCVSSFLGIGGGSSNVAVLFFFFSMNAKEAAKNSIFIIMVSQCAYILLSIITNTVPAFEWLHLLAMAAGGVSGAIVEAAISSKIGNKGVEAILKCVLAGIVLINLRNMFSFI